jgi:predicted exporter
MIKLIRCLWLIFIVTLGVYLILALFNQNRLQFDLLDLLPVSKSNDMQAAKLFMQEARLSNKALFVFGHKNSAVLQVAISQFKDKIIKEHLPLILKTEDDFSKEYTALFKEIYLYRAGLLSDSDRKYIKEHDINLLIKDVLSELISPIGFLGSLQLKSDPFYLFPKFIIGLKYNLIIKNVNNMSWKLVAGTLQSRVFSICVQQDFAFKLEKIIAEIQSEFGVKILKTGAVFYTIKGAEQAHREISNISIVSIVGIIAVLLVIFRTASLLTIVFAVIVSGIISGIAASLLIFNSIHVLSLVFGCSLVGVCIDYAIHYYCASYSDNLKSSILADLIPALPLGVLSSCLGYSLLIFIPFPAIQQMAVIIAVGLASSFISVALFGPCLVSKQHSKLPKLGLLIQSKLDAIAKIRININSKIICSILGLIILCSIVSLFKVKFSDDIRDFQSLNLDLKNQEDKIREIVNLESSTKFLQIKSDSIENLLIIEEKIIKDLKKLVNEGVLGGYRALASLQPSVQRQLENRKLLQEELYSLYWQSFVKSLNVNLKYSADHLGFFAPLLTEIKQLPSGWRELVSYDKNKPILGRILLFNVNESSAIIKLHQKYINNSVSYIDQTKVYSDLFAHYRQVVTKLILIIIFIFTLVLSIILGLPSSLRIMLPVLLAIISVIVILSWSNIAINLFHVMGLLLVLCLGIDYSLFSNKCDGANNLLANALSAVTTILSFGLLCFSGTTAVSSFGLTVFIGIFLCFVLTTVLR